MLELEVKVMAKLKTLTTKEVTLKISFAQQKTENSKRSILQIPLKNQSILDYNTARNSPIISSIGIRFLKPIRDDYPNKISLILKLKLGREVLCGSIIMKTASKN